MLHYVANKELSVYQQYQYKSRRCATTLQLFLRGLTYYMLFENGIDKKDFENTMLESLLYDSDIKQDNENFTFTFKAKKDDK